VLKWSATYNPQFVEFFGGLRALAPLHLFGAWMLVSFVIVHVYMTTTGHTPLASIKAMITGYEIIEEEEDTMEVKDIG